MPVLVSGLRKQNCQNRWRGFASSAFFTHSGLEIVEWRIGRLRHLIWNGYHEEAHDELFGMRHMASEVAASIASSVAAR